MRSESPTRVAASGSNAPPLLLENIREEGDAIEEINSCIPDLASSTISTPVTTVSWLDGNACDTYPTEFTELPEETTGCQEGPSEDGEQVAVPMDDQLQASEVLLHTDVPSVPEVRGQMNGATKRGRNRTVVPPSTRQLRKRQAAEEPPEDAHTPKKPRSVNG